LSSRKRVNEENAKVHDGAKELHWKCSTKKTKTNNKFKGWLEEGKAFMEKMIKVIKDDVKSGAHEKWEKSVQEDM
jgi:hypothetical protein